MTDLYQFLLIKIQLNLRKILKMIPLKKAFLLLGLIFSLLACSKGGKMPPINNSIDLDGTQINDSSLTYPERFLLSAAIPYPTATDLSKPVIICVHGFSATTFEWIEFRDYSKNYSSDYLTSIVLLGGHGRDYSDFKTANIVPVNGVRGYIVTGKQN